MAAQGDVALPVPFDNPSWNQSNISICQVMGADNRISQRPCLVSSSGSYYEIGRTIRESIYGHVSHGLILHRSQTGDILVRSNPPVNIAIKVYQQRKLVELRGRTQENPVKEMAAMQYIRQSGGHINIIHTLECCIDNERVYCIMEFLDQELFDLIAQSGALAEGRARFFFRQIVLGLQYLHSLPVCHRDMSLENVLVNRQGLCKIIDMGMCLKVAVHPDSRQPLLMPSQGVCGKRNYIAPEVFRNITPINPLLVDVWALGVMLFILATGTPPMDAAIDLDERYRMIARGNIGSLLQQWNMRLSLELVDLLTMILRPIPTLRPSIEAILNHAWMQQEDTPVEMND